MRVFGKLKRAVLVCAQKIVYVLISTPLTNARFWRAKMC